MAAAWQDVLDRHGELFEQIEPNASLAIVGRRAAMPVCDPVPILIWVREEERMTVRAGEFGGYKGLASDLLLVANDGTMEAALAAEEPLRAIKRELRIGGMRFMVLRRREELREHGWEDFLEWLGMPFLGTCR